MKNSFFERGHLLTFAITCFKSTFEDKWNFERRFGGTSLLPEVIFISIIKPISSNTYLKEEEPKIGEKESFKSFTAKSTNR